MRSRRGSSPRRSRRTPLRRAGSSSRRDSPTDARASHRGWPQCRERTVVRESRGGGCRLDPSSAHVGRRPRRARRRVRRGGGRCGAAQLHPSTDDLRRRLVRRAHRRPGRRLRPDRRGHPGLDRAARPAPRAARDPRRRGLVRTRLGRLGPRPGSRAQPRGRCRPVRARARVPPRGRVPQRARSLATRRRHGRRRVRPDRDRERWARAVPRSVPGRLLLAELPRERVPRARRPGVRHGCSERAGTTRRSASGCCSSPARAGDGTSRAERRGACCGRC